MRRVLRRPAVWAAVLYAVLAIGFVSPALMPGKTLSSSDYLYSVTPWTDSRPDDVRPLGSNFELIDQTLQFEPFYRYTKERLPDMPLWNPYVMAGRPYLANAQSAVFSPFSTPAYAMPVSRALGWIAALKLFVAAFGAYLLARALRLRFAPALLAGIVYAFGLFFVAWVTWPLASVWAWLPWLLALTELVVRRPGPLPVAGLSVIVAFQFLGGHPESSFHVLFAASSFLLLRLTVLRRESPPDARPLRRPLVAFVLGVAGGALLAALTLIPLGELILNSGELEERTAADPDKIRPSFLAMAFLPDYWGRTTQTLLPVSGFINNRALYAGALPLMLATAAPVLRPSLTRVAIAAFGLCAVGVAVGAPPIHQIVNALPGFSSAHNSRMIIFYLLAVALLAAFTFDDLVAPERPPRSRWVPRIALLLACIPLVWLAVGRPGPGDVWPALETAWGFVHPPLDSDVIRLGALVLWVSFAVPAVVLLLLRARGRVGATAFAVAALALVTFDLFRIGMGLNTAIDEENARVPTTGAIEYLRDRRPERFVGVNKLGILPPIEPNLAMDFDLYDVRGYDYPTERRHSRLWKEAVFDREGFFIPHIEAPLTDRSLRVFSLLAAHDLVTAPEHKLRHESLRQVYNGPDARVYENERALPRASLVGAARVVDGEDAAFDGVLDPRFDPRREALVGEPIAGLAARPLAPGAAGSATIVEDEPERVVVEADARRRSLLVLADVYYPGWKAEVDGRDTSIERVDYLLRGIPLSPGQHRIEFRYEPASWRIGWILSLAGLILLVVVVGLSTASRLNAGAARERA
jgi:Bacterial membrane protein YfhO